MRSGTATDKGPSIGTTCMLRTQKRHIFLPSWAVHKVRHAILDQF